MQSMIDQLIALNENHWYISYIAVLIICVILYSITSKVLLTTIDRVFKKTSTKIDDILLEKKVFNKLPYLIPLVFIYNLEGLLPNNELIDRIVVALIFFIVLIIVISSLYIGIRDRNLILEVQALSSGAILFYIANWAIEKFVNKN